MSENELSIMAAALEAVEAVPAEQDHCWPGDDEDCELVDHAESEAAAEATEGLVWEFQSWSATAEWFRNALRHQWL